MAEDDKDKDKPAEKPPKVDDARKHVLGGSAGRSPGNKEASRRKPPYGGSGRKPKKERG